MSSDFLHESSPPTCRRYVRVGKVMLRDPHLLKFVKELDEGFQSNQCLGVTALDDVVLIECYKEAVLFLI